MKKEVLIKIKGVQSIGGSSDVVELFTTGNLYNRGGKFYISYQESEATGYGNTRTTLKVEDGRRVTMIRSGETNTQLIIEKGVRHQCSYGTAYGSILVGVLASDITSSLDCHGGDLHFAYSLDINTSLASENSVTVNVQELPKTPAQRA